MTSLTSGNIDDVTVEGFGDEWDAFDQSGLTEEEHRRRFEEYFSVFPFEALTPDAAGFDLGCGSGRWALLLAPRVGHLHCIDPSAKALAVARRRLARTPNIDFHHAGVDSIPLPDGSQDFGYALGVLHHIPDPAAALASCVRKLKPGAPFLVYLYYRFDNRPAWFRAVWKGSEVFRSVISRIPFSARKALTTLIAAIVYWPLARLAGVCEKLGLNVSDMPLSYYRACGFYTMRTDALDRFGTRLEHRFTRAEIAAIMKVAGLDEIVFRDATPYWVACGRKCDLTCPLPDPAFE